MKKILCLICATVLLYACSEWQNDLYVANKGEGGEVPDVPAEQQEEGQLYNMSFDLWSDDVGYDVCYATDATDANKTVWASANKATAGFGKPICMRETDFVAVSGEGKCAVKLQTVLINAIFIKRLASGNLFTGQMGNINLSSMNASLKWGVPFNQRPKQLEGYGCYRPVEIDNAKNPYMDKIGEIDNGHLFVILTDWDEQFTVDPAKSAFVDIDNDPAIIGYGKIAYNSYMDDYEKFCIDIEYRNDRTPKYAVIVAASSALGDYFTGGEGSVLYIDELRFLY